MSLEIPSSTLHQTSESNSPFLSHPPISLFFPLILETGTQRENCDKAILVCRQPTFPQADTSVPQQTPRLSCQKVMFPSKAATFSDNSNK